MTEYTYCPGYQFAESLERAQCLNLVKVWPGDVVNYCCLACFQTSWLPIEQSLRSDTKEIVFLDHGHSEQCGVRQADRIHETAVIDREFKINSRVLNGPKVS